MRVLTVDPDHPAAIAIAEAATALRQGRLVAFPTETVYGLGANALDERAVRAIFTAKGRPSFNPLIAHVAEAEAARQCAAVWPVAAEHLAAAFWPGPLTLVLPKRPHIPDVVSAGLATVALRVPAHPVARALLRAAAVPVAAPSANRSTEVSPTTAGHVLKGLGESVHLILDAGPTSVGIESTVVDLSGGRPALLRPGTISQAELEAVVGPVLLPVRNAMGETAPRPSPGMLERHYAPRATVHLFAPERRDRAVEEMRDAAEHLRIGAMLLHPVPVQLGERIIMPAEPGLYAQRLYSALHELDDAGCDHIWIEQVPDHVAWAGVRDRLTRAAAR